MQFVEVRVRLGSQDLITGAGADLNPAQTEITVRGGTQNGQLVRGQIYLIENLVNRPASSNPRSIFDSGKYLGPSEGAHLFQVSN